MSAPPVTELNIQTADQGFYEGFNKTVTVGSKVLVVILVVWAAAFPREAGAVLSGIRDWSFSTFGFWYHYIAAFCLYLTLLLAIIPRTGKVILGKEGDKPEFSTFSWIAMMFGAGIGIGMLTYSTAEPLYHFSNNPDVIKGNVIPESAENVRFAFQWAFLHWGLSPWGIYALVALSLAYFSFNRGLPLTIRSALTPLFGRSLEGWVGNVVDIAAVIATILGVAVTIGFGISQFSAGLYEISEAGVLVNDEGSPSNTGMIIGLVVVMAASTLSALSGVGKGIKWLSNLNLVLSIVLLAFFLIWGASTLAIKSLFLGIWDYLIHLPAMTLIYWSPSNEPQANALYQWQTVDWTVFYWAWWMAFAPFVGLFLARISRGRTLREFVAGAMLVPSLMCFIWFTFVGGTSIDLELNGGAARSILDAGQESQLFATLRYMLSDTMTVVMSSLVVMLLLTYLVTSADSAVLIINTINSGGDEGRKGKQHIIIWGLALTLVIAMLLLAGGLQAIQISMLIAALPFTVVMALMGVSLIKTLLIEKN